MTTYEKSAVIGYWRQGATYELIGVIMGVSESYVKNIIDEYLKGNKKLNP